MLVETSSPSLISLQCVTIFSRCLAVSFLVHSGDLLVEDGRLEKEARSNGEIRYALSKTVRDDFLEKSFKDEDTAKS